MLNSSTGLPVASGRLKLGILLWPQHTDWASLRDAGAAVDRLGFESLWTWDHLYPIRGSIDGPIFEGYLTLAGWAAVTHRVSLGLMVGANTFRNPALTVKMATTLDHLSGGRAVLGIGAAWFEAEHKAYGFDFGNSFGDRLDWLDEAAMIMRGMLDRTQPSGRSRYSTLAVRNDPAPLQRRLPILIGGGGEKKTLGTVARYADLWNVGGDVDSVRRKNEVLQDWCGTVGRDSGEIERTFYAGAVVARESIIDARRVVEDIARTNRGWLDDPELIGTSKQIADRLAPYVDIGFRHICLDLPAPFDHETLERVAFEVRPLLEQYVAETKQ